MIDFDVRRYRDMGSKAAANRASTLDADNANEFAAKTTARELEHVASEPLDTRLLMRLQQATRLNLSCLVSLDGVERAKACAAIAGGCYAWLAENPD